MEKVAIRATEEHMVDNKIMLERVDALLGKKTDIDKYVQGDCTQRSSTRRNANVNDSLASFDLEASLAMSLQEGDDSINIDGTLRKVGIDTSGDVESILAESEIDRMFDAIDPAERKTKTGAKKVAKPVRNAKPFAAKSRLPTHNTSKLFKEKPREEAARKKMWEHSVKKHNVRYDIPSPARKR